MDWVCSFSTLFFFFFSPFPRVSYALRQTCQWAPQLHLGISITPKINVLIVSFWLPCFWGPLNNLVEHFWQSPKGMKWLLLSLRVLGISAREERGIRSAFYAFRAKLTIQKNRMRCQASKGLKSSAYKYSTYGTEKWSSLLLGLFKQFSVIATWKFRATVQCSIPCSWVRITLFE